jgi:HSP20 family protein
MKAVSLYRPNTIHNALSDFDRYFESFFGDNLLSPVTRAFNHLPAVDVRETEKSYVMDMELPGYDEKDIEIHIDGSSLSIASKQEETRDAKDEGENKGSAENQGTWILRERRVNSFSRSFKLPENANPEDVTAEFKNGILSMEIKKRAEAQKRTIQIKVK